MNIGIVGSGKIGGVVGKLWARAGHTVCFSSRHPEQLDGMVRDAGPNASRATVEEALAFGAAILLSIPYGSVERFGQEHGRRLQGKVVIEIPTASREHLTATFRINTFGPVIVTQAFLPFLRKAPLAFTGKFFQDRQEIPW